MLCNQAYIFTEYPFMSKKSEIENDIKDSNITLGAGAGLGAYAGWTFTAGTVCPVCVVAAPALVGFGLYSRHKAKRKLKESEKNTCKK